MGRDKALLPWRGSTLLDHAVSRLRSVCTEVRVLSGDEERYTDRGLRIATDVYADAGPLAGIHAGLASLPAGGDALFLAVDLPFVVEGLLAALLAASAGHDAVVPVHAGGVEPLCAVYRPACLEPVRKRLESGERKMTSFWPEVRVRTFDEAEIARYGDPDALFGNLNSPSDYADLSER